MSSNEIPRLGYPDLLDARVIDRDEMSHPTLVKIGQYPHDPDLEYFTPFLASNGRPTVYPADDLYRGDDTVEPYFHDLLRHQQIGEYTAPTELQGLLATKALLLSEKFGDSETARAARELTEQAQQMMFEALLPQLEADRSKRSIEIGSRAVFVCGVGPDFDYRRTDNYWAARIIGLNHFVDADRQQIAIEPIVRGKEAEGLLPDGMQVAGGLFVPTSRQDPGKLGLGRLLHMKPPTVGPGFVD